jgi:hypothetical protein
VGLLGALKTTAALIESARQAAEEIADPSEKVWGLRDLAEEVARLGDPARAAALIEQALETAKGIGDPRAKDETLRTLQEVAAEIGDPARADALIEQIGRAMGESLPLPGLSAGDRRDTTWLWRDRDPVEFAARLRYWRNARKEAERYTNDNDRRAKALAKILEVWAESQQQALAKVDAR